MAMMMMMMMMMMIDDDDNHNDNDNDNDDNNNNNKYNVNKNPTDATVCRYLFTAKLLYMFRVSQHPSSGVLETVPAASGTDHSTCTGGCWYSF